MFSDNLVQMRKILQMTQEDIAERIGVTRQSVAKWEAGESIPDLDKCKQLADIFGVSLDDLANYEPEENMGLAVPPKRNASSGADDGRVFPWRIRSSKSEAVGYLSAVAYKRAVRTRRSVHSGCIWQGYI